MPRCPRTFRHFVANLFSIVKEADFRSQVTRSFKNVAESLSEAQANSILPVPDFSPGLDDVYLLCPNPKSPTNECGKNNRGSNAYTGNKLGVNPSPFNTISFCAPFFDKNTFEDDKKRYDNSAPTGRRKETAVKNTFDSPRAKGMRPFLQVKLQN